MLSKKFPKESLEICLVEFLKCPFIYGALTEETSLEIATIIFKKG